MRVSNKLINLVRSKMLGITFRKADLSQPMANEEDVNNNAAVLGGI